MSERVYLNNNWKFIPKFEQSMTGCEYDDSDFSTVRIPHTVKETPFNYFDESLYRMISCYRKQILIPKEWEGKSIRLTFEGVAHETLVFLNGRELKKHSCGYTAFTIDISNEVNYGENNLIALRVDSTESTNQPPFGHVIDYMTYGGVYRDVYLEVSDKTYIDDIFLYAGFEGGKTTLTTELEIKYGYEKELKIKQFLNGEELEIKAKDKVGVFTAELKDIERWDIDSPVLYEIRTQIIPAVGIEVIDEKVVRFGFRESEFKADGYYLNGRKVKLRGLNRHQSYPYVGYAAPASMQMWDAELLKRELGVNAVRTSHYPQSQAFIDRCDELGLLVFTEIPGWQHIGDSEWKDIAVQNVEDMVLQYRNHPSIILWGVRINESQDDDEFYIRTNERAHRLDPTRPTGGVRAHKKSRFFEDVYTYNDFVHDGIAKGCEDKKDVTPDVSKPYLVSEYNGHMFSTKSFDCEEHRREHAIRHANVLNAVASKEDIAGSFGWCMFDYNTHKDFGSGDRICYHGVTDMFRNPKLAAYVYACEQEDSPVLELSSSMDIGEHPGCNRGLTWIFSNADSVRMYKNDRFIKEYFSGNSPYVKLKHGPILIDDFIGDAVMEGEEGSERYKRDLTDALNAYALYGMKLPKRIMLKVAKLVLADHMNFGMAVTMYNKYIGDWGGKSTVYRFEAIRDGKVVKTLVKEPPKEVKLLTECRSYVLKEKETYDMAMVRIRAVDGNGNLLSFFNEPVVLETEGSIELVGDSIIGLKGGMTGALIRSNGTEGWGILRIRNSQSGVVSIKFTVEKEKIREM